MNQSFFPGVGNYIKSEALYAAKIHPEKKWVDLSPKKVKQLLLSTQDIMQRSFTSGGAELKDFKNPFHVSEFELKVYGKKEDEYGNEVISSTTSDQRKSWYCPKVQK
jgi:formamidopyrimidine-DNA glycosylase